MIKLTDVMTDVMTDLHKASNEALEREAGRVEELIKYASTSEKRTALEDYLNDINTEQDERRKRT